MPYIKYKNGYIHLFPKLTPICLIYNQFFMFHSPENEGTVHSVEQTFVIILYQYCPLVYTANNLLHHKQ